MTDAVVIVASPFSAWIKHRAGFHQRASIAAAAAEDVRMGQSLANWPEARSAAQNDLVQLAMQQRRDILGGPVYLVKTFLYLLLPLFHL